MDKYKSKMGDKTANLSDKQLEKLRDLKSSYFLLYYTGISLHNWYCIVVSFQAGAFIVMMIVLIGLIEVYKPLQRLRAFLRS